LVKESLNNKHSSRFHSCKVFVNEKNGNKLYYYDLAGFENKISIAKQYITETNAKDIDSELKKNISTIYNSIISPLYRSSNHSLSLNYEINGISSLIKYLFTVDLKKSDEKIQDLKKQIKSVNQEDTTATKTELDREEQLNKLYQTITSNLSQINNRSKSTTQKNTAKENIKKTYANPLIKDMARDRLDLLLESDFISESLKDLKAALINYRNNTNTELAIPKLGLKSTKFEKIVMFGFIRNDQGYVDKPTDETFLNGTKETLQFLNDLANPSLKATGGTIESPIEPTPFQPKQLLLESANKVTESALEPLMVGGGIIDKTVQDTDRSIVIMVTFFITFLSTYMKNTLSDKGVLKNKTEEMVTLVAFYSFFTLLFASLIELGSVDTMYMVTYLLAFGIIYITLNTYQEPKKQSIIKDRIEGEVIQEYKEMDSNLLISWMMSSIGVIFV
jgi:hypothetical protein